MQKRQNFSKPEYKRLYEKNARILISQNPKYLYGTNAIKTKYLVSLLIKIGRSIRGCPYTTTDGRG